MSTIKTLAASVLAVACAAAAALVLASFWPEPARSSATASVDVLEQARHAELVRYAEQRAAGGMPPIQIDESKIASGVGAMPDLDPDFGKEPE